jgi:hypothetical protein
MTGISLFDLQFDIRLFNRLCLAHDFFPTFLSTHSFFEGLAVQAV